MVSKYKYYKFDNSLNPTIDGIIRIKDIHYKACAGSSLIEVDEYCGNFSQILHWHWYLNNDNLMFEASNDFVQNILIEVTEQEFSNKLIEEMNKTVVEIKNGNHYPFSDFKKTPVRIEIIRKYYVR